MSLFFFEKKNVFELENSFSGSNWVQKAYFKFTRKYFPGRSFVLEATILSRLGLISTPIKFEKANFFHRLKFISKALINTLNAPSFSNGTKLENKIWTYWVLTKTKHGLIHENLKLNKNEANEKLDQKIWHRPSRKLPTRLRILVYVKSSYLFTNFCFRVNNIPYKL